MNKPKKWKPLDYEKWLKKRTTKAKLKILFANWREFNSNQLKLF